MRNEEWQSTAFNIVNFKKITLIFSFITDYYI